MRSHNCSSVSFSISSCVSSAYSMTFCMIWSFAPPIGCVASFVWNCCISWPIFAHSGRSRSVSTIIVRLSTFAIYLLPRIVSSGESLCLLSLVPCFFRRFVVLNLALLVCACRVHLVFLFLFSIGPFRFLLSSACLFFGVSDCASFLDFPVWFFLFLFTTVVVSCSVHVVYPVLPALVGVTFCLSLLGLPSCYPSVL